MIGSGVKINKKTYNALLASKQRIWAISRHKGWRHTIQKQLVIDVVFKMKGPFTVYELTRVVNEYNIKIADSTIYNILNFLEENGIVTEQPRVFVRNDNENID